MPKPLREEEFEILEELSETGDRVGYYGQLEEWGYKYGELARGVVTGDQLSGRTANNFFEGRATVQINGYRLEQGETLHDLIASPTTISKTEMAELSHALMVADLGMRKLPSSPNRNGEPLHVDDIQDYHEEVFSEQFLHRIPGEGISIKAWTPYDALQKQDSAEERDEMWRDMLEDSALMTAVNTKAYNPFSGYAWRQSASGIEGVFGGEGNVGPYRMDIPGATDGGQVIAGTGKSDGTSDTPELGTNGSDTVYMFGRNDTVRTLDGDDRAYLGDGHDKAELGEGDDRAFPGAGKDDVNGGPGIDFIDYSKAYNMPEDSIFIGYASGLHPKDNQFSVLIAKDNFIVGEPTLTTYHTYGLFSYKVQSIDTATEVEGYTGSGIRDVVALRDTDTSLYLSGGAGNEDAFIAYLPPDVAAGAIFDDRDGIIPEGEDFGGYNYDGRLQIDPETTVYVVDFESTNLGGVREGRIADIAPELIDDVAPSLSTEDAIRILGEEQRAIDAGDPVSPEVQGALDHPDAYAMFGNLDAHGIETIPAEITSDMPRADRIMEILSAGHQASVDAGIPMPSQTRSAQVEAAVPPAQAAHETPSREAEEDYSYAL